MVLRAKCLVMCTSWLTADAVRLIAVHSVFWESHIAVILTTVTLVVLFAVFRRVEIRNSNFRKTQLISIQVQFPWFSSTSPNSCAVCLCVFLCPVLRQYDAELHFDRSNLQKIAIFWSRIQRCCRGVTWGVPKGRFSPLHMFSIV